MQFAQHVIGFDRRGDAPFQLVGEQTGVAKGRGSGEIAVEIGAATVFFALGDVPGKVLIDGPQSRIGFNGMEILQIEVHQRRNAAGIVPDHASEVTGQDAGIDPVIAAVPDG